MRYLHIYGVESPEDVTYKECVRWNGYTDFSNVKETDTLFLLGLRKEHFWIVGYNPVSKAEIFEPITFEEKADTIIQRYDDTCKYTEAYPYKYNSSHYKTSMWYDKGFILQIEMLYSGDEYLTAKDYAVFNYNGDNKVYNFDRLFYNIYNGHQETVILDFCGYYNCRTFQGDSLYTIFYGNNWVNRQSTVKEPEIGGSPSFWISYDTILGVDKNDCSFFSALLGYGMTWKDLWETPLPSYFSKNNKNSYILQGMHDYVWEFCCSSVTYEGEARDTTLFLNLYTGEYVDEIK